MSKKEDTNNQEPSKRSLAWIWILLVGAAVIGGYCYWQNIMMENTETYSYSRHNPNENEIDSFGKAFLDSLRSASNDVPNQETAKSSSRQGSSYNSYDYEDDDDDELDDDPEYRPGGKYDPAHYHTDYGKDEEQRRRNFIDNDGWDEVDGYDEYYGYEHENERSAQWDD